MGDRKSVYGGGRNTNFDISLFGLLDIKGVNKGEVMENPRHWRLKKQRYQLIGEECPHCREKIFPPRDICPRCGGGTLNKNLEIQVRIIPVKSETRAGVEPA